jgi:hypothetical protein
MEILKWLLVAIIAVVFIIACHVVLECIAQWEKKL